MEPSKQSDSNEQPPAYHSNPGYPGTLGYNNPGFVGTPHIGQGLYAGQPPIIVQPPAFVAPAPLPQPFPDYLGFSIFTMLCCCLPLGIGALIYSINTREANMSGNGSQAERSSRMARLLNFISLGIGIVIFVISIILIIVSMTNIRSKYP